MCVEIERWPVDPAGWPACVPLVAMPWRGVAAHLSHGDTEGRALHASLDDAGVSLAVVELTPMDCLEPDAFEQQTDDAYMQMQCASRMGAEAVTLASCHIGAIGFDTMVDVVRRLAALAQRIGVRLFIRNANGSALEQPESVARLLSLAKSKAVAACIDNVEFQRAVANPADAALVLSGRTAAVRLRDERPGVACMLGDGVSHVIATVESLQEEGFDGLVITSPADLPAAVRLFGVDL